MSLIIGVPQSTEKELTLQCEKIFKRAKDIHLLKDEGCDPLKMVEETSEKRLNELLNKNINVAEEKYLTDIESIEKFYPIINTIRELFPDNQIINTGHFLYPKNGFMGWHTNSNEPYYRVYLTYTEEGNKSFFRYMDWDTKKIITSWDQKGLTIRKFKTYEECPLWHCVGSETNRLSLGYELV